MCCSSQKDLWDHLCALLQIPFTTFSLKKRILKGTKYYSSEDNFVIIFFLSS